MRSFRWTWVFAAAIVGLVALTVYDFKRSEQENEIKESEAQVLKIHPDEVTGMELETRSGKTVLAKTDGQWRLISPIEDRADNQAVLGLLASMESEKVIETVAEGNELGLSTYGLENPVSRLRLTDAGGIVQTLKIGSIKAFDSSLYAQRGDANGFENKVLLLASSWDLHLGKPLRDLRDKLLFRSEAEKEIANVEIHRKSQTPIRFEKSDGVWKLTKGGDGYPISQESVRSYIDQVKAMRALDFVSEDKSQTKLLVRHGLETPELKIRLDDFELRFGRELNEDSNVAAVSSDLPAIVAVYKTASQTLAKKAEDFYDKKLPFQFDGAEVTRLRLIEPGQEARQIEDAKKISDAVSQTTKLEAVRFLANGRFKPGQARPKYQKESRLVFEAKDGKKVFEMVWGASITEKPTKERPESTYLPVHTNLIDRQIGVPEASVRGLVEALKE